MPVCRKILLSSIQVLFKVKMLLRIQIMRRKFTTLTNNIHLENEREIEQIISETYVVNYITYFICITEHYTLIDLTQILQNVDAF
jgi:hypothetical protein